MTKNPIENPQAAELFSVSLDLLRNKGRLVGAGYILQEPLEIPPGKVLVIASNFEVRMEPPPDFARVFVSLKDESSRAGVTRNGNYTEHLKSSGANPYPKVEESRLSALVELANGVATKLLGS